MRLFCASPSHSACTNSRICGERRTDIDRLATLLSGATEDPLDACAGCKLLEGGRVAVWEWEVRLAGWQAEKQQGHGWERAERAGGVYTAAHRPCTNQPAPPAPCPPSSAELAPYAYESFSITAEDLLSNLTGSIAAFGEECPRLVDGLLWVAKHLDFLPSAGAPVAAVVCPAAKVRGPASRG